MCLLRESVYVAKIQANLVKGPLEKNTLYNLRKGTLHGCMAA